MKLSIKEYKKEYQLEIEKLIADDRYVQGDIINCLERWPQHGLVVECDARIIAVGVFVDITSDKKTSITLYVKPEERQKGIGTWLLQELENKMKNLGVKEAVSDFKTSEVERLFLYKYGYKNWFSSNLMSYAGEKLFVPDCEIIQYEDKYYKECHELVDRAFHEMRLLVGLSSGLSSSSEEGRRGYQDNTKNVFLLRDEEQTVAVTVLEGNELDSLAVKVDKQRKGYGEILASYAINELLDRKYEIINLWVVEGNPAINLYQKLGFIVERTHEFVIHTL